MVLAYDAIRVTNKYLLESLPMRAKKSFQGSKLINHFRVLYTLGEGNIAKWFSHWSQI